MDSLTCPKCREPLTEERDAHGLFWQCRACGGRAVGLAVLRRTVTGAAFNEVWQEAREKQSVPGCPCPSCANRMEQVHVDAPGVEVDVCPACALVWFDAQELAALPALPATKQEPELPPAAREALAMAEVAAIGERYRTAYTAADTPEGIKVVPAIFGLPVETEDPGCRCVPWVTWGLTLVASIISLLVLINAPGAIERYGLVPAHWGRYAGLTTLSVFFLHGGLVHLIGNMYFFLLFGNNVEDFLGRARYAALLFAATLAGSLSHITANPASTVPCIGASGGIAGVMAFYALAFPQSQIAMFLRFRWITMPAYLYILIWVAIQVVGAWQQLHGFTNVSAFAHLGGVLAGVLLWLCWREVGAQPAPSLPAEQPASPDLR